MHWTKINSQGVIQLAHVFAEKWDLSQSMLRYDGVQLTQINTFFAARPR